MKPPHAAFVESYTLRLFKLPNAVLLVWLLMGLLLSDYQHQDSPSCKQPSLVEIGTESLPDLLY
jgi:hypothetical protein